jgi:hypothetical protein
MQILNLFLIFKKLRKEFMNKFLNLLTNNNKVLQKILDICDLEDKIETFDH